MICLCKQIAGNGIELSPICVGSLWIFKNLAPEEIEALNLKALRKKTIKGKNLFLQGDSADEVFLIKSGRIKLTKAFEDGTELMLDTREPGDIVGENIFFEEGRYPVSAVCLEETLTCGFTRRQFERLMLQHPTIGPRINKTLDARISWLTNPVDSFGFSSIEDRLYRVLCNAAKESKMNSRQGVVIPFPPAH